MLNDVFAMLYTEADTRESSYCDHLCNRKFASALNEHHEILNSAFGDRCSTRVSLSSSNCTSSQTPFLKTSLCVGNFGTAGV
jgi:hypothetical protein